MFDSVEELVEENDRRHLDDMEPEHVEESTPVYVPPTVAHCLCWLRQNSQERSYRAYQLLVRHIPVLKQKLDTQDVLELNAYFRDVSHFPALIQMLY